MSQFIENTPEAGSLMGSMRSIGYSFETAIADIIDNSISADAHEIHLFFPTEATNCFVAILDDGYGMSKETLFLAMRYGSAACEDARDEKDLGRFGLGMKAASLSQCRILTVVSKQEGRISAFRWDYNTIQGQSKWLLQDLSFDEIKQVPHFDDLFRQSQGTLVVWQDFDIIDKSSNGLVYTTLRDLMGKLIDYVGLIFHRFISSNNPDEKINLYVNQYEIPALDPFLEKHNKTTKRKEIDLAIPDKDGIERHIEVQPYILPFIKDLKDADVKKLGGVENMRVKQGFYIYRNKRLIIWGTWYGLQRTELTKNARIRVDIPNSLDDIWSIDVKKQNATIPSMIQRRLKRAVEDAMNISVRQQTYRGRKENIDDKINYVWNRMEGRDEGHYFYEVNRETELFKFVKSKISDEAYNYVEMLIEEIEKGLPFQQMYLDSANNCIQSYNETDIEAEALQKAIIIIDNYLSFGLDVKTIVETIILADESFCCFKNIQSKLYKHYKIS